jgi:hypothetical protein
MKKTIAALLVGFGVLSLSTNLMAAPKTVTCQIDEQGKTTFKGKCSFNASEGGSFYLTNLNKNKPIFRNIMDVSVYIIEPGVAEVSGSLKGANNSRWGQAIRSTKQKACWVGSDFKVCAW